VLSYTRSTREVGNALASRRRHDFSERHKLQVYVSGWQKTEEQRFRTGETLYMPAGSHLPENLNDQPFEVILVELKR
jgi:hypothetical protein